MNLRLIQFGSTDEKCFEDLGMCREAVAEIFLGTSTIPPKIEVASGTPAYIREWIAREYGAADFAFRALRQGMIQVPDLWSGKIIACHEGFTSPGQGNLPYEIPPLYYHMTGTGGKEFWLISYGVYGRITHIFLPSENVVIYDYDRQTAHALAEIVMRDLTPAHAAAISSAPSRTVAVVNMVNNHGHQLMNHLSGVARMLEEVNEKLINEIWIAGIEFFSPFEKLFPEIAHKTRRFARPWDMHSELSQGGYLPLRIGTNIFRTSVRDRIRNTKQRWVLPGIFNFRRRRPLVAITVRAAGRVCRNLPDALGEAFKSLSTKYPRIGVILDGWVIPDGVSRRTNHQYYNSNTLAHMEMVRRIQDALPPRTVVGNTIGHRMTRSVTHLSGIDAYISHVGTLQHKLAFLTGAPGVVHGPREQLITPDSGHFQTDTGFAPLFLAPGSVRDIQTGSERGEGFNDYEITDVHDLASKIDQALCTPWLREAPIFD